MSVDLEMGIEGEHTVPKLLLDHHDQAGIRDRHGLILIVAHQGEDPVSLTLKRKRDAQNAILNPFLDGFPAAGNPLQKEPRLSQYGLTGHHGTLNGFEDFGDPHRPLITAIDRGDQGSRIDNDALFHFHPVPLLPKSRQVLRVG